MREGLDTMECTAFVYQDTLLHHYSGEGWLLLQNGKTHGRINTDGSIIVDSYS